MRLPLGVSRQLTETPQWDELLPLKRHVKGTDEFLGRTGADRGAKPDPVLAWHKGATGLARSDPRYLFGAAAVSAEYRIRETTPSRSARKDPSPTNTTPGEKKETPSKRYRYAPLTTEAIYLLSGLLPAIYCIASRTAVTTSSGFGQGLPKSLASNPHFRETTGRPSTTMSNCPRRPFSSSTGVPRASWMRAAKLAAFVAIVPQVPQ